MIALIIIGERSNLKLFLLNAPIVVGGNCGSGGEPAGGVGRCIRGLGLGCDASCRRWGSPTPTKVKNLLPPCRKERLRGGGA